METVVDGLTFTEAPRWRDGKLWFSDFYTQRVLTVTPGGRLEAIVEIPQRPSGLGWTPDGALLVVSMLDRRLLRVDGGKPRVVADLSSLATGPCNDMVVDGVGRAYVGNFGFDRHRGEPPRTTCIARVDPDGRVTRAADELSFPNGTVITPDGRTLIVAETLAHRLTAFDVAADGALLNRRLFAALEGCFPDGICLDADGGVWVADARRNRVLRVRADGTLDRTVTTGQNGAYACMLGGPDRTTLFICSAPTSEPGDAALLRQGRISAAPVDVPGAGHP
jgi:sugar lactone lactonase YvrE